VSLKAPEDIAEVNALFLLAFDPGTAAWDLRPDGTWMRRTVNPDGGPLRDLQETLIEVHRTRGRLV
jgi:polyphosphate kinase